MLFYVHVAWFGLWTVLNSGWFGVLRPLTAYGLLTIGVSLEAVLTTSVRISQNRPNPDADLDADLALHIGLTEHEVTRVLQMLGARQVAAGTEHGPAREPVKLTP